MKLAPAFFPAAIAALGFSACVAAGPGSPREPAASAPPREARPFAPEGSATEPTASARATEPSEASTALSFAGSFAGSTSTEAPSTSPAPSEAPSEAPRKALSEAPAQSACNEQAPQEFLIRSRYAYKHDMPPEEIARRSEMHRASIEYRTRRYGYFQGFGQPGWNRYDPVHYSDLTTFFGLKVRMNKRVIPALACVEAEIRRACSASPYVPHVLDGIRFRNTYKSGEITNHAYGIAIDIDPDLNSCCGCVPQVNSWSRCSRPATSPYDRASIPKCWVDSFTKYGFYWLGDDPMEDTMHFEFLGDPDKILKGAAPK